MNREEARQRAKELVAKMTVEEKASQLRYDSPAIDRLGVPAYNWRNEALHGVARAGTATMFPQAIALAAAFDKDLMKAVGEVIAEEGRAKYNEQSKRGDRDIYKGLTFWSPNVNIFRDPRLCVISSVMVYSVILNSPLAIIDFLLILNNPLLKFITSMNLPPPVRPPR